MWYDWAILSHSRPQVAFGANHGGAEGREEDVERIGVEAGRSGQGRILSGVGYVCDRIVPF